MIGGRSHQVLVRFSDDEFLAVAARAAAERSTASNYLARVGLAGGTDSVRRDEETQLVLHQLMMLRAEIRRVGQNVNQVARLLHGTGEVARAAESAYRGAARAAAAVEAAAGRWRTDGGAPAVEDAG
jgi:hypothetical protein